jgi:hypothetical protein
MSDTSEYTFGSSNDFADLGLPHAEEHLLKAQLADAIHRIISARKLSPAAAAEAMDLAPPTLAANAVGGAELFVQGFLRHRVQIAEEATTRWRET